MFNLNIRRKWRGETDPRRIVSVTIPKSGTLFMHTAFTEGLSLPNRQISPGYFPHDYLDEWSLRKLKDQSFVSATHLAPSLTNRRLLESYLPRWHVHLRDPRSVTLSWTHHVLSYARLGNTERHLVYVCWDGPEDNDFLDWDFDRLLDWNIENFLPRVVAWQRGWLRIVRDCGDRVLLTNYEDLLADQEGFVASLCEFFRVPVDPVMAEVRSANANRHFRTGRADEWADVWTPDQQRRAELAIGDDLLEMTNRPRLAA